MIGGGMEVGGFGWCERALYDEKVYWTPVIEMHPGAELPN